jgi:cob(I)alamin adenosyltransferase
MSIYTRRGDKGQTKLLGSTTVSKDHPRVEAYGCVDELNAVLGTVLAFSEMKGVTESLKKIQNDLFLIGAELASKGIKTKKISPVRVSELEKEIDQIASELPPLKNFILPGGSKTASLLHLARTICRRAERKVVAASKKDKINPNTITYLNRVGDLLFMQARYVNYKKKVDEIVWRGHTLR